MQRRPDDCRVARFVEERPAPRSWHPSLCDTLVSAVEVLEAPDRHPASFAGLLVGQRRRRAARHRPAAVVIRRRCCGARPWHAAGGAALLALALAWLRPRLLRAGATAWLACFPHSIGIEVLTGDVRVPAGPAASDRARRSRAAARDCWRSRRRWSCRRTASSGRCRCGAGGGFSYAFESVDRSFHYRVVAGSPRRRLLR